jgi:hypothetical protein
MNELFVELDSQSYSIRNGKGQFDAFAADVRSAKFYIENFLENYGCRDFLVCQWDNHSPRDFNELNNMILNSQPYTIYSQYNNHTVEIRLKLNTREEKSKVYIFIELYDIRIIIEPDYTESDKNTFVDYMKKIKLKQVTCDNEQIMKLSYNPKFFKQEYQDSIKNNFARDNNINQLDKINVVVYSGMFLNLLNSYNTNCISCDGKYLVLKTPVKYQNKPNCPPRKQEIEIECETLQEIINKLDDYLNKKNLKYVA